MKYVDIKNKVVNVEAIKEDLVLDSFNFNADSDETAITITMSTVDTCGNILSIDQRISWLMLEYFRIPDIHINIIIEEMMASLLTTNKIQDGEL